jgi:crossover junction endodeoxyribonuclease RusA
LPEGTSSATNGVSRVTTKPTTIRLVLPMPPSINAQYVVVGKRKRVLSKTASAWKKDATKVISMLRDKSTISPIEEKALGNSLLGVYMTFYFETPMRRDLDGGLKIALDTIATNLGFDDRSVVDIHLTKQIDPLHPRLEVEIETIHDWTFDREYVYLGEGEDEVQDGEDDE